MIEGAAAGRPLLLFRAVPSIYFFLNLIDHGFLCPDDHKADLSVPPVSLFHPGPNGVPADFIRAVQEGMETVGGL